MNPVVSIITLNWNRRVDVLQTLASIYTQTYEPKEIIVVDNGSTDGSMEEVQKRFPRVTILQLPENVGVEGYNQGMKTAIGEYLLLIDNDMDLLQSDTLQQIVHYFQANPKLGAVALQVRDQKLSLSPNNPKYWEMHGDETNGYPCSSFDGGGVGLRKDVLQKVGYYSPEFFVYHSEVDLSTRIWDADYEIRYFPRIAVSHRESPIARNRQTQTFYSSRNYFWYVWKYYPFSQAVRESFHFLQRSFFQNLRQNKSVTAWCKGILAAVFGSPKIFAHRRPVKKETIEWMQRLRVKDRERKQLDLVDVDRNRSN